MSELKVNTMAEFMAQEKVPEILFWVGSAGSFDDRAKKITRAFVKILNKAGVNFGVLGTEESSSGDAAIFMLFSSTLIQKTFSGKKVVVPTPTKASVDAIAIKSVLTPATVE